LANADRRAGRAVTGTGVVRTGCLLVTGASNGRVAVFNMWLAACWWCSRATPCALRIPRVSAGDSARFVLAVVMEDGPPFVVDM